jgi:hypothetical protein
MSTQTAMTDDLLLRTLHARATHRIAEDALARDIALEVRRTPQEPRSRWHRVSWFAPSLAAGSVALLAVLAIALLGPLSSPAIRELRVGVGAMETRVLDGGRYRSTILEPNVELTIPGGRWVATGNLPAELELRAFRPGQSENESGALTILRIDNVMAGGCGYQGATPWRSIGSDPESFMAWLRGQLPANLGATSPITIGGLPGLEVAFQTSTDLRQTCDYGFLLTDVGTATESTPVEIPIDGRRVRLAAVEASGTLMVVMTAGPWTNQFGDSTSDDDAMVASMTFPTAP